MKDILGVALDGYLKGVRGQTSVIRDDGFSDREPIERYFKGYSEWCEVEKSLFKRIKGDVLEIGCNVGEHLRYLQQNSFSTTGIDISLGAIKIAKERGVKNCLVMDAREIHFLRKFNTVLILYYGFGLGGTVTGQKKLLDDVYRITNIGGQIICSSIDALKTDNPQHIAYQDYNKRKGKMYGDITQVTLALKHKNEMSRWYDLLFIGPKGIHQIVQSTGWRVCDIMPEKEGGRAWYYVLCK